MGAPSRIDLLCAVRSDAGGRRDPTQPEEAQSAVAAAERSMPEELSGIAVEDDLGAVDLPEEYGDWKDEYADAVCVSRWREL